MSLEIKVTVPQAQIEANGASDYLTAAMQALGFSRGVSLPLPQQASAVVHEPPAATQEAREADAAPAATTTRGRGRPRAVKEEAAPAKEQMAISTGEERIDPEQAAQDKADEAADTANAKTGPATHDDVRAAMKAYLDAFGPAALNADMSELLGRLFAGQNVSKVSEIPEDALGTVLKALSEMLADNPHKRERV